jgi:SET domain-containing protein
MPASTRLSNRHIEVRQSDVHGLGVFARCDLPKGAVIGKYTGKRYTSDQGEQPEWDSELTYLFQLSDGTVIDGARGGNATRHLNHACEPNCEAVEFEDERGRLALRFETSRAVRAGEELFIDYALIIDPSDDPADYPCACGAPACRGTMAAV